MIFDDVWSTRQGDLDRGFGELFMVAAPAVVDPGDPQKRQPRGLTWTFTGIWTETGGPHRAHNAEGHAENSTRRIGANHDTVDFILSAVPFPILRGYIVTRLADGTRYSVAEVSPDDVGRATLSLTAATKAPA